jgi:hypothetical protein
MSDAPPGTVPRAQAAAELRLDDAGLDRLIAAGALTTTDDGQFVTQLSMLQHLSRRISVTVQAAQPDPTPRWLAVVESVALMTLLVLGWMAALVQLFSWQNGAPILSPPTFALAVGGALAVATALARRRGTLGSGNGFGTTLYGRRRTPEGVVATAWLIAAMVPLVPLASYVLLEEHELESSATGSTQSYMLRQLPGLHWPQVVPWLLASWAGLLGVGWLIVTAG